MDNANGPQRTVGQTPSARGGLVHSGLPAVDEGLSPGPLSPEWVAMFCVHWQALAPADRMQVAQHIDRACVQTSAERCIYSLQQGIRLLGVTELQIIRLILTRYMEFSIAGESFPARQIALQVAETINLLQSSRRGAGRSRRLKK